jgi:hypothetical protein
MLLYGLLWGVHRWGSDLASRDGMGPIAATVPGNANDVEPDVGTLANDDVAAPVSGAPIDTSTDLLARPMDDATNELTLPEAGPSPQLLANLPPSPKQSSGNANRAFGSDATGNSPNTSDPGTKKPSRSFVPQGSTAKVFGISSKGSKFVYIFDRSGSMSDYDGAPILAAKRELLGSITRLSSDAKFQVIFYNDTQTYFQAPNGYVGKLAVANSENKLAAKSFINAITAAGGTEHYDALVLGLRMAPDAIFFLTDADLPAMTEDQLSRISDRNQGTVINTIEFGTRGQPAGEEHFLVRLAHTTGGAYTYFNLPSLQNTARAAR